ncbi:hypothetical protein [Chlamydiifrater volucris]|uniref:hypothetical protein n=1 Tax=Chlamydiifrater volucris TaxID=2681470 RepID=UPI001BD0D8EC|nr:hypothetical protein [Chlamydiifrater volucris]
MESSLTTDFQGSASFQSVENCGLIQRDVFVKVSSFAKAVFLGSAICLMISALSLVFEIVFPSIAGVYVAITAALLSLVGVAVLIAGFRVMLGHMLKILSSSEEAIEHEVSMIKSQVLEVIDAKKELCDGSLVKFPELDLDILRPLVVAQNKEMRDSKAELFSEKTQALLQELVGVSIDAKGVDLFMDGCTQVLKRGKFLKDKSVIDALTDEEKLRLSFPCFASLHLKELEMDFSKCQEESLSDSDTELFNGSKCCGEWKKKLCQEERSLESCSIRDFCKIFSLRFSKELFFLMLGSFSSSEIKEIADSVSQKLSGKQSYLTIYADLIKKYPRLVAVEAMFLNWLRVVYPYTISSQHFDYYQRYFCDSLARNKEFFKEQSSWSFLENFSGVLPATMALFRKSKGEELCSQGWSWSFFCQKAMEYSRRAALVPGFAGNLNKFHEYVKSGDAVFGKTSSLALKYVRSGHRFDKNPFPLWNMRPLYQKDPVLEAKLREGLCFLKEVEFSGGELFSLIHLEITALGLDESTNSSSRD